MPSRYEAMRLRRLEILSEIEDKKLEVRRLEVKWTLSLATLIVLQQRPAGALDLALARDTLLDLLSNEVGEIDQSRDAREALIDSAIRKGEIREIRGGLYLSDQTLSLLNF